MEAMTVAIPEERIKWMIVYIKKWRSETSYTLKELSSLIGLLLYVAQLVNGVKSAATWLMKKKSSMTRSVDAYATCSKRLLFSLARIQYIVERWKGVTDIYDRNWQTGPDLTIFCDAAIDKPFPKAGSFGKGTYAMPPREWRSTPWTEEETTEGRGLLAASSTYFELLNMLESKAENSLCPTIEVL